MMPEVDSTEAYLVRRRFELCRVALEGMTRDEAPDPREAQTISDLRRELGIALREHEMLECSIRGRGFRSVTPSRS